MQTFRRLNDPERWWGLSWRGWIAAAAGGGLLYLAVRVSPLPTKPTITITILALALAAVVLYALSGQAIGPGRYLLGFAKYQLAAKHLTPPDRPDKHGFVLDAAPDPTPALVPQPVLIAGLDSAGITDR